MTQILYVLQGIPGSGKSDLARYLRLRPMTRVVSTDDEMVNAQGVYEFRPAFIGQAHTNTQVKARELLRDGFSVVVDNTNIHRYEAKPYVKAATEFGVPVVFIRVSGPFRSTHNVPQHIIDRMVMEMEELYVEGCLHSIAPWEVR